MIVTKKKVTVTEERYKDMNTALKNVKDLHNFRANNFYKNPKHKTPTSPRIEKETSKLRSNDLSH